MPTLPGPPQPATWARTRLPRQRRRHGSGGAPPRPGVRWWRRGPRARGEGRQRLRPPMPGPRRGARGGESASRLETEGRHGGPRVAGASSREVATGGQCRVVCPSPCAASASTPCSNSTSALSGFPSARAVESAVRPRTAALGSAPWSRIARARPKSRVRPAGTRCKLRRTGAHVATGIRCRRYPGRGGSGQPGTATAGGRRPWSWPSDSFTPLRIRASKRARPPAEQETLRRRGRGLSNAPGRFVA